MSAKDLTRKTSMHLAVMQRLLTSTGQKAEAEPYRQELARRGLSAEAVLATRRELRAAS